MTRLAIAIALGLGALPCAASAPQPATKTKVKPRAVLPNPPPNVPMQIPPTIREPILSSKLVETVLFPDRALAQLLLARAGLTPAHIRMQQLLNESEDLRQARKEWHRFWMNNQPGVLTADRLKGAIGP